MGISCSLNLFHVNPFSVEQLIISRQFHYRISGHQPPLDVVTRSSHFSLIPVKSGEHPKCCRKTRGYQVAPL